MSRSLPEWGGITHRDVDVGGVRLHVAEAGGGEPVILQHGWPQHWYAWRHVIGPLAQRYRVICPDMRGFGWSAAPRDGYAKQQIAGDIVGLLDALELETVRYVGHDWGGFVGFLLGVEASDRISRLVALSIPHLWPPQGRPSLRRLLGLWYQLVLAAPGTGRIQPAFVKRVLASARAIGEFSDEDLGVYAAQFTEGPRVNATRRLYRTFLTRELPALARGQFRSRRLTVPTLQLVGSRDPVLPPEGLGGYESYADNMSAELIDGAGHFPAEETPRPVIERLLAFLAGP